MTELAPARKIAFLLIGALVIGSVFLHLGGALVAGLFSYMVLDMTYRKLAPSAGKLTARYLSLGVFLLVATAVAMLITHFTKLALNRLPDIIGAAIPKIEELLGRYGLELPFENVLELRMVALETVREHAPSLTKTGGLMTKGFFHTLIGIFVAVLCFAADDSGAEKPSLYREIASDLTERVALFMVGFEKIFGAQILISSVNTVLTAAFLLGVGMPYINFLVLATFILGMLPLLGTLLSSSLVVAAGLMVSPQMAVLALGYLIVIHKLQVFIYSHFIGITINIPVWQVLTGVLLGEALMGIPGIILAPALLHYVREELHGIRVQTE